MRTPAFPDDVDLRRPGASASWVPSILEKGDSLATLASLYKVDASDITSANGVAGKVGTCAWGREISKWVLATGGVRLPVVASQKNECEPGLGFTAFVAGQVINLPAGGPRAPAGKLKAAAAGLWLPGLAVAALGLALKKPSIVVGGGLMAARILPPGKR